MKKWGLVMILFAALACQPATIENSVEGKWYGITVMEDAHFETESAEMMPHEVDHFKRVLIGETAEIDLKNDGTYRLFGKWILSEEGTWKIEYGQIILTPTMKMYTTNHDAVMEKVEEPIPYGMTIIEDTGLSTPYLTRRHSSEMVFSREQIFAED